MIGNDTHKLVAWITSGQSTAIQEKVERKTSMDPKSEIEREVESAARMYACECALHNAHQSHVDAWITAASDRLHDAIAEHLSDLSR